MLFLQIFVQYGILHLLFNQGVLADTLTVTITDSPNFLAQRRCAIYCYVNGVDGVINPFGCPSSPLENACWCRDDLMSSAAGSVSTCVSQACSGNSEDVQSATSIYMSYCSQNGYFPATPTADAGGNSGGASTAQGAGGAKQTAGGSSSAGNSGTNNGNNGNGGGDAACGNQVSNVSGVNIVCGSKNQGGLSIADQRSLTLALGLGLGLPALFVALLSFYA